MTARKTKELLSALMLASIVYYYKLASIFSVVVLGAKNCHRRRQKLYQTQQNIVQQGSRYSSRCSHSLVILPLSFLPPFSFRERTTTIIRTLRLILLRIYFLLSRRPSIKLEKSKFRQRKGTNNNNNANENRYTSKNRRRDPSSIHYKFRHKTTTTAADDDDDHERTEQQTPEEIRYRPFGIDDDRGSPAEESLRATTTTREGCGRGG